MKLMVSGYKYDGWLYRTWEFPKIIFENDDLICLEMTGCRTYSSSQNRKRVFKTLPNKEYQSYWVFPKGQWYNFIIRKWNKNGNISYKINLASPYIIEEESLKFIDLDIDFMVSSINKTYRVLDIDEYDENKVKFQYPKKLNSIIEKTKEELEKRISSGEFINEFGDGFISKMKGASKYNLWLKQQKNK